MNTFIPPSIPSCLFSSGVFECCVVVLCMSSLPPLCFVESSTSLPECCPALLEQSFFCCKSLIQNLRLIVLNVNKNIFFYIYAIYHEYNAPPPYLWLGKIPCLADFMV